MPSSMGTDILQIAFKVFESQLESELKVKMI